MKIRIGTRGSELALYQAKLTLKKLEENNLEGELFIIKTKGDMIQDLSFDKIEGKGFFTKELEDALLHDEVDIAVHSMKDLPTTSPEDLCITALIDREDPRDCLIIRRDAIDKDLSFSLKKNAIVGTSSVRRSVQIRTLREDVIVENLRGNVPTRISKLKDGLYDAIILASAGIKRLAIEDEELIFNNFHPREMVPAPAQGAIAIQCLKNNTTLRTELQAIHMPSISRCTNIERSVLHRMDGGCQLPLGVHCIYDSMKNYHVHVTYAKVGVKPLFKNTYSSSTSANLVDDIVSDLKRL